ncbi:MAG: DUF2075 domain-containing protein [Desulfobacterales bacterium]|nr:DUF2075 domain-containing protein [Desulfobacterales bacterium]
MHWFLNDREDTRSSYYLEDAATEFQVQGLELDWMCVTWDGDLRFKGNGWSYHDFRGDRWTNVHNPENRRYPAQCLSGAAYPRPAGDGDFCAAGGPEGPDTGAEYYDSTYEYLVGLGVPEVQ